MQISLLFSSYSSSNSSRHLQSDEKASPPPPPFLHLPPPPFLSSFGGSAFTGNPPPTKMQGMKFEEGLEGDGGARARTRGACFESLDSHGAFRLLPPCLSISYSLFSSWCAVLSSSHISLEKNRVGGNAGAVTAAHEREIVFLPSFPFSFWGEFFDRFDSQ